MSSSVFRSEQGRLAIQDYSRKVLASSECPLRQHDVPTSCGLTHVLEAGPPDGAPLVILHGTSTNAASWLGDLPVWGQSYRVLAVDMPGEPGLSADHRLGLSNGDVEQWLVDLLDAMGLERVSLVGMSLGGLVALRFAAHQPERVQALCLIAPAGLAPQRLSFPLKALPLTLLGDWGFRRINRMVWYDVEIPEVMLEFGRLVFKHFRPLLGLLPLSSNDDLRRLHMPVLYLAGAHDALVQTQKSAARLAKLVPHAEIHVLEDRGHVVIDMQDVVLDFLLRAMTPGNPRLRNQEPAGRKPSTLGSIRP